MADGGWGGTDPWPAGGPWSAEVRLSCACDSTRLDCRVGVHEMGRGRLKQTSRGRSAKVGQLKLLDYTRGVGSTLSTVRRGVLLGHTHAQLYSRIPRRDRHLALDISHPGSPGSTLPALGGAGTPYTHMHARRTSSTAARGAPFHPPANRDSFKDLLVFEERLKQNASRYAPRVCSTRGALTPWTPPNRLQKQRRKYEGNPPVHSDSRSFTAPTEHLDADTPAYTAFLLTLSGVIAYLGYSVFVLPSIVSDSLCSV